MKTTFFFLLFSCGFAWQGQSQNKECGETIAAIQILVSENNWTEAYEAWSKSGVCALANEAVLQDGEKILKHQIEAANDQTEKTDRINELIKLYTNYDKKFPANGQSNLLKKALLLKTYKIGTDAEIYALLDQAFKSDWPNFNDASGLFFYFEMFAAKYKSGDKTITANDFFTKYDVISQRLKQLRKTQTADTKTYNTAIEAVNALASPLISCDKLAAFYKADWERKKEDASWLQQAVENLMDHQCSNEKVFLDLATEANRVNPTAKSAYQLAVAHLRNRNPKDAADYFNQAAALEDDPNEKATILYAAASAFFNDKSEALNYLKKAVSAKPDFGKAYLLIAQLYANAGDCGQTPFEKKAIYFLAAQTVKKAGEADQTLKSAANKQAENYLKKAPSKEEIKREKMAGKKIAIGCWINETILIPEAR